MKITSWLQQFRQSVFRATRQRPRRSEAGAPVPTMEVLESRLLLTPVNWRSNITTSEDTALHTGTGGLNPADSAATDENFTLQSPATVRTTGGDRGGVFEIRAGENLRSPVPRSR